MDARRIASMKVRSLPIPHVVATIVAPAAMVIFMPVYATTLVSAGGGHAHMLRVMAVSATVFAIYAIGAALWLVLRRRISRDAALNLAVVAFIAGTATTLFSFGHRTAGESMLVASVGGLAMSLPNDVRSARVVLRFPTRGTLIYWVATLELPAFLVLALATRDYLHGNNSAAVDFGTAFFLYFTYVFGYLGWSAIRTRSAPMALFGACFFAFWGFFLGLFLASLGPISLIAPVAGVGGVVACIPYLWDSSQDGATAVTRRDAAH